MPRITRTLAATAIGLLVALLGPGFALALEADPATLSFNQQKMLEFLNAERAARGVAPVERDAALDAPAQGWAERLAAERRGYHSPEVPALAVGYGSGAESLAWGPTLNAAQTHVLWMSVDSDRRYMLDPAFTNVGIGLSCSTASGRPFVVAVLEMGGDSAPSRDTPPAQPRTAGGESLSGRSVTCGEAAAPATSSLSGSRVVVSPVTEAPDPGDISVASAGANAAGAGTNPAAVVPAAAASQTRSTGLVAVAFFCLLAATFVAMKSRIAEARLMANLRARPRLNTEQLSDLLDDYHIE